MAAVTIPTSAADAESAPPRAQAPLRSYLPDIDAPENLNLSERYMLVSLTRWACELSDRLDALAPLVDGAQLLTSGGPGGLLRMLLGGRG